MGNAYIKDIIQLNINKAYSEQRLRDLVEKLIVLNY